MESELAGLQRRVAELESALAVVSQKTDRTDHRRRLALAHLICTGIVTLCVGILLGGGAGSLATAQSGPSKVVAPFSVVDSAGHELFRVASSSGTGVAIVYNNGVAQVTLGSPTGSQKPQIQVLSPDGSLKAGMGLRTSEGDGVIQLWGSKAKTGLVIGGRPRLDMYNEQFKRVVSLGIGEPGTAELQLNDNNGNQQVAISSPPPGSGKPHIQVLAPDGSLKAGMGINPEGNGVVGLKGAKDKSALWLTGNGLLQAVNPQEKRVVSLGVSGFGGGDLHLYNSSGTAVVGIFSEQGQTGIVQLFNAGGQERVTLGTRTTGKGDVCASGDSGQLCLGRLNPKY